ncbi:sigma-70 family RNA polymerase sigma factor [Acidaminococcus fermentans]|uniref:sigma-70 family RNA polymerase sigma factor n=1 Tax=Acidaminococcus fermentans TaxID=905 RepID=UPI002E76BC84|nr:sigma-70 family RNA polymerase sigma factor [Acidaminococcus fermentans]MEE1597741.1 sigma-70 family RNA polymerase sigma factor [Acidaminococcus fermentans]MEE4122003.1 sigma-70 family RNA polymerase sigma factor [Acidaminococcus fermentans]
MNKALLQSLIKPYQKNNELTYDDFDKVFSKLLSRQDQYQAAGQLEEMGIQLVDEITAETSSVKREKFPKVEETRPLPQMPLVVHDRVKQSNSMLCRLIQKGDCQACQDLCTKNRPLVLVFVNKYKNMVKTLDEADLEQHGFMGLIKAAKRFDLSKENEFSTYAVYWIQQEITRAIDDKDLPVRIPVHMVERIHKINKIDSRLYLKGMNRLSDRIKHIAQECDLSEDEVEKAFEYRQLFMQMSSLEMPIGEEKDTTLSEFIPDDTILTPEDQVCTKMQHELCSQLLETLKPRECEILKLRIGWDDDKERTLEEIGKMYGVTRERIRQIEKRAVRKIKGKTALKELLME